ncbi:MAG: flagellar biosynthesis protein FliQ [Pseudomonadales bacterium]|nr:flagellar biosynthesis protein FliQ [Pseudomonadales bacterium]
MDVFRSGMWLAIIMTAVLTIPGLVIGLVVAIFQAATQINEQTLSFLPRLLVTLIALVVAGPWLGKMLFEFTQNLLLNIPQLIG